MHTPHKAATGAWLIKWLFLIGCLFSSGSPVWAASPQVASGGQHTCALLSRGTVQCWGYGGYGQLGNGRNYGGGPDDVIGINNAIAVSAGSQHTCAVLSSGTVQCWGRNLFGQLGNGTKTDSKVPVTVSGINNAIAVSAGEAHTCAVLSSGAVQCWGYNFYGRLGNGVQQTSIPSADSIPSPVTVSGISNAIGVSAGYSHTCAVLSSGEVQCWGVKNPAVLKAFGFYDYDSSPATVNGIGNAVAVSAGSNFTCALLRSGAVRCWGSNYSGALGDGTQIHSASPVSVSGINDAIAISSGSSHACAVLNNGSVKCWGDNRHDQFGIGRGSGSGPETVSNISAIIAVAAGGEHTCAVDSNGEVPCWGSNLFGELGNTLSSSYSTPIFVGGVNGQGFLNLGTATLADDADKVFAWAERTYAQMFTPVGQASQTFPGYRFRSYISGHYLAVNDSGTARLYYLGPLSNNTAMDLGLLSGWIVRAGP